MNDVHTQGPTMGDGETDARLVDIVLGPRGRAPGHHLRLLVALLVAFAVHGALIEVARYSRPSLATWSAQAALLIHQELTHTLVTDLEQIPPPQPPAPKPAEPEPPPAAEPEPTPRASKPEKREQATQPPREPAAAGQVIEQEESALVDMSATTFATGTATSYAGGATTANGVSRQTPAPVAAVATAPSAKTSSPTAKPARPVTLEAGEWRCPWPDAALSADIYQAFVVLRVTVDSQGRAEAVKVLEDPGYGFGAAAVACAKHTRFSPALDSEGKPRTASSPPIRVRFVR